MTEVLLTNARVVTQDPARPHAAAVLVRGDRVAAVFGRDDQAAAASGRHTVDLGGAVLTPGFHDAHNHMAWFGLNLLDLDLSTPPVKSLDDLYAAVAARAATLDPDAWVLGSGYDQNKIGGHPDRERLDRAAGGRKVWLKHTSGHLCFVSSAVLAVLGLSEASVPVDGGRVAVDPTGRPTGLLEETAQTLVAALVLPHPLSTLEAAIERAGRHYLSEGITSVVEAGIGGGWIGQSPVELAAYQNLHRARRLPVRVELMIAHDVLHPLTAAVDDRMLLGLDLGLRTGFGDDWLRIGPIKIFADGSLIGRTAAMTADFADAAGNRGYLQADRDYLVRTIVDAHVSGWRVAAHAIGDAAIDLVLDAYEEAQRERPEADARHRIEHFGVARPDQVARAARLGVVPVPQARFISELGDGIRAALGDRTAWAYRQRSLLDAGLCLPGSSDRPVVVGAPLLGMHDLVNQRTASGEPFSPAEAISGAEALYAYTAGSAYASHAEHRLGSITPGKLADFAVLSDSPAEVAPDAIADIEVLATYIAGQCAFERHA